MKTSITVEELYAQSRTGAVEIPILKDIVPYLSRSPGVNGKTLAHLLKVKRGVLSNGVQLLTGETLNDLMKHWKLLTAMHLLRNTSLPYKEVAKRCGYKTINALSKFMERMIKCTAYEYRENRTHGNRQTNL